MARAVEPHPAAVWACVHGRAGLSFAPSWVSSGVLQETCGCLGGKDNTRDLLIVCYLVGQKSGEFKIHHMCTVLNFPWVRARRVCSCIDSRWACIISRLRQNDDASGPHPYNLGYLVQIQPHPPFDSFGTPGHPGWGHQPQQQKHDMK